MRCAEGAGPSGGLFPDVFGHLGQAARKAGLSWARDGVPPVDSVWLGLPHGMEASRSLDFPMEAQGTKSQRHSRTRRKLYGLSWPHFGSHMVSLQLAGGHVPTQIQGERT